MSTGDISDPEWAEQLRQAFEQARETSAARLEMTDELVATQQWIDDLESRLDTIDDPAERDRAESWVAQARLNNKLAETDTHLLEHIAQLQEAVLTLADGMRGLQQELRERG
jgi:hypothetical protein